MVELADGIALLPISLAPAAYETQEKRDLLTAKREENKTLPVPFAVDLSCLRSLCWKSGRTAVPIGDYDWTDPDPHFPGGAAAAKRW
jgi:hypothetical protein